MSAIRKSGNRSTEWKLGSALIRAPISGWVIHERSILGCPDFWFEQQRLAIFVDGCFWHGCKKCCHLPKQNISYWHPKIAGNVARDRSQTSRLRRSGIQVMRIWEHNLTHPQKTTRRHRCHSEKATALLVRTPQYKITFSIKVPEIRRFPTTKRSDSPPRLPSAERKRPIKLVPGTPVPGYRLFRPLLGLSDLQAQRVPQLRLCVTPPSLPRGI